MTKLTILFYNIGPYHLARINAATSVCAEAGFDVNAIQIAATTDEHPWGDISLSSNISTLAQHRRGGDHDVSVGNGNALLDVLELTSPNIVAVPGWGFDFARQALRWCRKAGRSSILMSESKVDDARRYWPKELLKRLFLKNIDAAVVGGRLHAEYLHSLGFPEKRIFRGYDVVDNDYFTQRSNELRRQVAQNGHRPEFIPTGPYFVASSRFLPRKNLPLLVRAFGRWKQAHPVEADNWKLVLLGGGPEESAIRSAIAEVGLESSVLLPGFVPYQSIVTWYVFAEALVHPALVEQWGLVTNEVMACGTPVILSRTCGSAELITHGRSGLLFDPRNEMDLAAAMHALAESRDQRAVMGQAALEDVNRLAPTCAFGEGMLAAAKACLA